MEILKLKFNNRLSSSIGYKTNHKRDFFLAMANWTTPRVAASSLDVSCGKEKAHYHLVTRYLKAKAFNNSIKRSRAQTDQRKRPIPSYHH